MAKSQTTGRNTLTVKRGVNRKTLLLLALAAAVIGGYFIIKSFAGGGSAFKILTYSDVQTLYATSRQGSGPGIYTMDTTPVAPANCAAAHAICHSSGSSFVMAGPIGYEGHKFNLIPSAFAGGSGTGINYYGWRSDPAANARDGYTWFGPYETVTPSQKGSGNDGRRACFNIKDIGNNGKGGSVIFMDVIQSNSVLSTSTMTLPPEQFTQRINRACVTYDVMAQRTETPHTFAYSGTAILPDSASAGANSTFNVFRDLKISSTTGNVYYQRATGTLTAFNNALPLYIYTQTVGLQQVPIPSDVTYGKAINVQYRLKVMSGQVEIYGLTQQIASQ
jgi:hypothetical protein